MDSRTWGAPAFKYPGSNQAGDDVSGKLPSVVLAGQAVCAHTGARLGACLFLNANRQCMCRSGPLSWGNEPLIRQMSNKLSVYADSPFPTNLVGISLPPPLSSSFQVIVHPLVIEVS